MPQCIKIDLGTAAPRMESGPLQFNEQWPGVYIDGQTACYAAFILRQVLDSVDDKGKADFPVFERATISSLVETLNSCFHAQPSLLFKAPLNSPPEPISDNGVKEAVSLT